MGLPWTDPDLLHTTDERLIRSKFGDMAYSLSELAVECDRVDHGLNERWSDEHHKNVRSVLVRLQDLLGVKASDLSHNPSTWYERNQWTKYFVKLADYAAKGEFEAAKELRQPVSFWENTRHE